MHPRFSADGTHHQLSMSIVFQPFTHTPAATVSWETGGCFNNVQHICLAAPHVHPPRPHPLHTATQPAHGTHHAHGHTDAHTQRAGISERCSGYTASGQALWCWTLQKNVRALQRSAIDAPLMVHGAAGCAVPTRVKALRWWAANAPLQPLRAGCVEMAAGPGCLPPATSAFQCAGEQRKGLGAGKRKPAGVLRTNQRTCMCSCTAGSVLCDAVRPQCAGCASDPVAAQAAVQALPRSIPAAGPAVSPWTSW